MEDSELLQCIIIEKQYNQLTHYDETEKVLRLLDSQSERKPQVEPRVKPLNVNLHEWTFILVENPLNYHLFSFYTFFMLFFLLVKLFIAHCFSFLIP